MTPTTSLPASVRRQVASAAEIEQMLQAATAALPQVTSIQEVAAPPPVAPVAPPTPVTPPQPAVSVSTPAPPNAMDQALQQLARQNEELTRQLTAMGTQVEAQLKALKAAQEPAKPPVPAPGSDPRDAEVFGPEVIAMVDRKVAAAIAQVQSIATSINTRIEAIENKLGVVSNTAEYTVEQAFLRDLTSLVPGWQAIDKEPGWHEYLRGILPGTRKPRQHFLNEATGAYDAQLTADIFNAYLSTKAPAPTPPSAPNELEAMSVPASSAPAAPAPPAQAPIFKVSQVQSFYDDVARGKYRGREEEMRRIDAAINVAVAANRIIAD
jgi:uncharacterized protein YqgV (UPF0045/DUF77 family)